MDRRNFNKISLQSSLGLLALNYSFLNPEGDNKKIGIIGLDTSHAPAFTKIIHNEKADEVFKGLRVTHAYPKGSEDIESSYSRIPRYTKELKEMGISITQSIDELLAEVDFVLIETNDGKPRLAQARQVIKAGKPFFIDKPVAHKLEDVKKIFKMAKKANVPIFSASGLRYAPTTQEVANNKIGKVLGADTFSPAKLEASHPDMYWYGIHGIETLFTAMGPGCKKVQRVSKEGFDLLLGEWEDGRIGTFRGIREGKSSYGGTAFGEKDIAAIGKFEGYEPLLIEIGKFFNTGKAPVAPETTIEIYAFMSAADESKQRGGEWVELNSKN